MDNNAYLSFSSTTLQLIPMQCPGPKLPRPFHFYSEGSELSIKTQKLVYPLSPEALQLYLRLAASLHQDLLPARHQANGGRNPTVSSSPALKEIPPPRFVF